MHQTEIWTKILIFDFGPWEALEKWQYVKSEKNSDGTSQSVQPHSKDTNISVGVWEEANRWAHYYILK